MLFLIYYELKIWLVVRFFSQFFAHFLLYLALTNIQHERRDDDQILAADGKENVSFHLFFFFFFIVEKTEHWKVLNISAIKISMIELKFVRIFIYWLFCFHYLETKTIVISQNYRIAAMNACVSYLSKCICSGSSEALAVNFIYIFEISPLSISSLAKRSHNNICNTIRLILSS